MKRKRENGCDVHLRMKPQGMRGLWWVFLLVSLAGPALLEGLVWMLGLGVLEELDVLLGESHLKLAEGANCKLSGGFLVPAAGVQPSLFLLLLVQLPQPFGRLWHWSLVKLRQMSLCCF